MMPVISGMLFAMSSSLVASIVAKVTVTTAMALIGVWLSRRSRAAIRHALLAAAFGMLLVLPIATVLAPPVRIAVPFVAQERAVAPPHTGATDAIPLDTSRDGVGVTPAIPQSSGISSSSLLLTGWVAGVVLSLLPMAWGQRQVRSLCRTGLPWHYGQSVVERLALEAGVHRRVEVLLHEALPGPMTCGAAHSIIFLPLDAQTWEDDDLNRAIVHELEHVRRGDWVSQCLARTVCALYWFHPLVWVARRQLALEAEHSCDDAVLGRSEATAYAQQLVGLARRLSTPARAPYLAMANRAELTARIAAVLDSRQRRGRAGALPVAFSCAAAAVLVLTMSPLSIVAAPQSSSAQTAATPEFDAASVKLINPNVRGEHSNEDSDPVRLTMTGTMHRFLVRAYGMSDAQLSGEPDWFKTRLYSIDAVTSAPTSQDQKMLMLRSVLTDRFQLKLRQEDRDLPVYTLEVAPGGPKFKELRPGEVLSDGPAPADVYARSFSSIQDLMNSLNNVFGGRLSLDRPVVNGTHLTGKYKIKLETEIETQTDDSGRRTTQFPNLFHDLQSELGLKLTAGKARMPYFIVENAAEPTPN